MTKLVDGKKIAGEILQVQQKQVRTLNFVPRLAVIMVGENPASNLYVKMKQKRGDQAGIIVDIHRYTVEISQAKLIEEIKKFNTQKDVHGILVQLPLPASMNRQLVLDAVDPQIDVDCLTSHNKEFLIAGKVPFHNPPAPSAILEILDRYQVDLKNSHILIVGTGDLIGEPLSAMLLHRKLAFELANRHTGNLTELAARADVIITGVGKAGLITRDMIKQGAVIIDAGTTGSDDGGLVGDVDTDSVIGKASLLAPVPGGVGPVTVAMLLKNVINSALYNNKEV
ncbi:MAG: hypothetical protein A2751_04255 [Candidatus Doudnabacteria bacterium RIFCSPHIGHO2_01_FULL_46_14]|uniref:Bifunctional protein FolD n=1 Tax=Candidatus Doudnabacteria bacterium RIFCSPHIGHO2_01_FULL_46_14 TaxID=1817824 RepID=A0A1F5NL05_9BACT|nr:MAG: hypothetical protein A2751_04255 [Candidatus Doudnabacteria bacterium RIFCSPHIGHO2_01_FULL_46_14]